MMKLLARLPGRVLGNVRHPKRIRKSRVSQFERLEARRVLAAAVWNNVGHPTNVDGDAAGIVSPIDALLVINELNSRVYSDNSTGALPKQVEAPLPDHFYDVSCDNFVSPLDALLVINFINQGSEAGGSNGTGVYPSLACSPQLEEGINFASEFTQNLTLPDDSSAVKIHFVAPEFDVSSRSTIRDAFEIEITDSAGNQVTFPYLPGRDAIYNWSEDLEPQFGAGVETTTSMSAEEDSTATVNLSGMEAGTQVRVTARLVNNDLDEGTSVVLRGFEIVDATANVPTGVPGAAGRLAASASVDIATLTDVSGSFRPSYGRTTLAGNNNELMTEFIVTNRGSQTVTGEIIVAIGNVSELEASAMRPDGLLRDGRPFWDLTHEMDGNALAPGESIRSREIAFKNDSGNRFTYKLTTYGSLNAAPSDFISTPVTSIEAGHNYVYLAEAVDSDEQPLEYSVVVGPAQAEIDSASGRLTWATSVDDIGSHNITLRATDPHGLFVEQSYKLEVLASLQNRPPIFISDPVTDAIASSGFEISTVGVGDSPAGVAVVSGFRGPGLVTLNTGDQSLSQIDALGNDRFDLPTRVSVGEPAPTGQVLRAGYSVDVGLPAFENTADDNEISGMDQADLNDDGTLDLVVSSQVVQLRLGAGGRTVRQFVTVTLGNPDGTFGEATRIAELPSDANSNYSTVRVADFDEDGLYDILTVDERTSTLHFLRGDGRGGFADPVSTVMSSRLAHFKTVDLDQDGSLDLIGTLSNRKELGYLLGRGDGTFDDFVKVYGDLAAPDINSGPDRNYSVADMDGDGDQDIVIGDHLARAVKVLANDDTLIFSEVASMDASIPFYPFSTPGTPDRVYTVFAGDFNGDGDQDIAYGTFRGSSGQRSGLGVYLGDGSGSSFTYQDGADAIVSFPGNGAGNGEAVDLDNDGDLDIVLVSGASDRGSNGQMPSVLINRGDGTFTTTNLSVPGFGEAPYDFDGNEGNARGVLVGDYNQDGLLDLSVYRALNQTIRGPSFDSVTVILADQPGVFASSSTLLYEDVVNAPKAFFEAGDFDNDGIVDLWSPSYQGISRTWLGLGDGTFRDPFPATPALGSEFLASGTVEDFNQDGILDVFWNGVGGVQNGPLPRYLAALGNGDGTFEITFSDSSGGRRPDWGDFNGDGFLDFAAADDVGFHLYLYNTENPGTWTFETDVLFEDLGTGAAGFEFAMSVDDFTGDGNVDVAVVAKLTDQPFDLVVYPGLGDGAFSAPVSTPFVGTSVGFTSPQWMATGDFNEDGVRDVVVNENRSLTVSLGVGDGSFGRTDVYPAFRLSPSHTQLHVRDIDQDGHDDVLFTDTVGGRTLGVLPGNGDGSFGERLTYDLPTRIGATAFGDFDNDGREDVVTNSQSGGNYATILYGARQRLTDIVSVDLNGDGNDDVLATNTDNSRVKLFLGDNLGNLNRQSDLFTDFGPVAVTVADLDEDGNTEIVTANRSGRSISILSGGVDNWTRDDIRVGQAPIEVVSGFVDSDDAADLLVIDEVENALWVLSGNGDTTFSEPVPVALGDRPGSLLVADVDSDGNNDAVISLPDSSRIMILPGDGQGGFADSIYVTLESAPGALAAVDFNDDGHLDLAATLGDDDQVAIIYGRGQNQFARPQLIAVGDNPVAMSAEDADDDGRIDLIVTNQGDDTASVIYNRFDPNEVYRYDSDAIDPDDDPLIYAIVDGPGGLILNSETGVLLWAASPDQVGEHSVTLSADDGRGGVATQSFIIDVQPARENAAPLLATEAATTLGAAEVYTYQATALDGDNDALRYRLLDGPEGATIDSTTGLVTFDGRGEARKFREFGENGTIEVAADNSFRTQSITVEGWFNIHTLTASNGGVDLFRQKNDRNDTFYLGLRGNDRIRFTTRIDGNQIDYQVPFIQEANRWYHFALTIDDPTQTVTIYVDGEVVDQRTIGTAIKYAGNSPLEVIGGQASVDNFRVWSVVRTQEEIQQGMSQQYDDNPLVTIDLRMEDGTSFTAHDSSLYGNDGFLLGPVEPQREFGLTVPGERSFTISVEDGRGGYDEQSFTVDVLPELRGRLIGHLFDDLNSDGDQDDGSEDGVPAEPSLEGWHLWIDSNGNAYPDPHEAQATTDTDGNYEFSDLLPGSYHVRVSPVAGFATPAEFDATVEPEINRELDPSSVTDYDLAIEQLSLSHIRGQLATEDGDVIAYWKAYADLDGDGTRGENEPMAMSDRNGDFALTGLDAGTYTIRTELPAGWADSAGRDGLEVTLAADEISSGNDFTLEPTNTSVTGGVHFVTMPGTTVEARDTFTYASVAMGISTAAIAYDLSLAPEGMVVDPSTGLTAWRPTIDQVGEHLVILRATDASGSISLHDFTLDVTAPNTATVIHAPLPEMTTAYAEVVYSYDVIAQDAESTLLTYALPQSPSGATIDATTGRLNWTPAAADVGSHDFTVEVTDEAGASTTATWTVEVQSSSPSVLPLNVTLPRSTAAVTTSFFSRITATDAIGRPVTWLTTSGPSGLTIASDGTMEWTPAADQLGVQSVELSAATADGETETVSFEIEVLGRALNSIPTIDSEPTTSVSLGQTFEYGIEVFDADQDIHAFTLLEGPIGMSVHPSLGTVSWTPAADQLGEHDVLVQVSDPSGDTAEQTFTLAVSRFGGPPRIVSIPPTEASTGVGFLHSVEAVDREGDPLTYTLLAAPAGMTIVETTGEIAWTPTVDQVGQQDVVIQVSDGIGGATTQAFVVNVSAGVANLPPEITSSSPRFGAVGTTYSYTLTAVDPESTTISFSLGRGPDGMAVDSSTGLVSWTPTIDQVGKHVVTLIATDEGGAKAVESFEFDVLAENTVPQINSTATAEIAAGAVFMYDVLASDADRDQLQFELTMSPVGATIDTFGRVRWETEVALIGSHDFTVKVSDPRGGEAMQSFTLDVIEDLVAPKLSAILFPNDGIGNLPWGTQFKIFVRAIDNVAIRSLSVTANGEDVPLDAGGIAEFTFEKWGFASITATTTAIDTNGNITTKTSTFSYDPPQGWNGSGGDEVPTALITSPSDTDSVTGMVSIVGTASHEDFALYKLSYRHVDDAAFTEFFESTTPVTNGELGVWDTSLLLNDEYVIRLQVATTDAVVNVADINVGLAGELKLGNFQLSFTDMVIPVAGIPIEITRIYDTLQADREGDFGYGWRLEYRNTDLRVGLPSSGLEDIGIYSALRPGVKVYSNVPGEGRQGFTFNPDIRVLPGFGDNNLVLARPRFTPDPGVTSSLSTGVSQYLLVNEQGELYAPGGIPYNPASPDFGGAYVLTTREGVSYRINGATGKLDSATDRNGDTLSFSDTGIRSSGGDEIPFTLDAQNRIVRIADPSGNAVHFNYSLAGDLESTIDREGNVTEFVYSEDRVHYLEDVIDPLGRVGRRAEYNAEGRLIHVIDANGVAVESSYDPDNSLVEVTDQLGNITAYEYDQLGNIVSVVDPLGGIQRSTYNSFGLPLTESDALGRTIEYSYDASGNEVSRTDAAGFTTHTSYGVYSIPTSRTDALGRTVHAVVDSKGVTTKLVAADGTELSVQDGDARDSFQVSFGSAETLEIRLANDRPNLVADPNGQIVNIDYDQNQRPIVIRTELASTNGIQTVEQRRTYDGNGRTLTEVDARGNATTYEYDAAGNLVTATSPGGKEFSYEYNELNLPITAVFPDGTRTEQKYDAGGNQTASINQAGQETRYEYDAASRRVATIFPDKTPSDGADNPRSRVVYDLAGQVIAELDELGNQTTHEYDALGQRVSTVDALGGETRFEYDALGSLTAQTDQLGNVIRFRYDSSGRRTQVIYPDGTSETAILGIHGQATARTNQSGETTLYKYDSLQRLTAVGDPIGNRTSYEYDGLGRLVNSIDALGRSTRREYNASGQLIASVLETGEREALDYDADGLLISVTDFNGTTTKFEYDDLGRVIREISDDGTTDRTYSPTGNQLSASDGRGTVRFDYDERDRLIHRAEPDGHALTYVYDAVGNIIEIASLSGSLRYVYDALNRPSSVIDFDDGVTVFQYDAASNLVQITHPNDTSETRVFDYAKRITSIHLSDANGVLERFEYTLDPAGRRISLDELGGRRVDYAYDAAGRLLRETIDEPSRDIYQTTFSYDAVGNRISRQAGQVRTDYVYDSRNRLLHETSGSEEVQYHYDANGSLIRREAGPNDVTEYEWNAKKQLESVTKSSAGEATVVEFEYDANGNRVSRTESGIEVKYLVDANRSYPQVIDEYDSQGQVQVAYVLGPDELRLSQTINGEQTYLHADHLGSVRLATNGNGMITDRVEYNAYGEVSDRAGTNRIDYLYAGEYRDDVVGLDYLRARHLDVSLGRFASTDPFDGFLNSPISLQPYIYVGLDPINNRDPSGEVTLAEGLVTSLIVGTLNGLFVGSVNAIFGGRFSDGFYTGFAIGFTLTAGALTGAGVLASSRAAGITFRAGTFSAQRFAALNALSLEGQAVVGSVIATLVSDVGIGAFQLLDYLLTTEAGSDQDPTQTLVSGDSAEAVYNLGKTLRPGGR